MRMTNQDGLDPVLHQPLRTRLVAFLAGRGEATFKELRNELDTTDGNLDAHIKRLTEADYIQSHKDGDKGRAQTFYKLTPQGRRAFRSYVKALGVILDLQNT